MDKRIKYNNNKNSTLSNKLNSSINPIKLTSPLLIKDLENTTVVNFTYNGSVINQTTPDANKTVAVNYTFKDVGVKTVNINYPILMGNNITLTVDVLKDNVGMEIMNINETKSAGKLNVEVFIKDSKNNTVNDGFIIFKINGKTIKEQYNSSKTLKVAVVDGCAKLSYNLYNFDNKTVLGCGVYNLEVKYISENYNTQSANKTLNLVKTKLGDNQLGPIRVKVNENAKIKMTLTDEFGNFLKGENTVIIRINGRTQIRQEIKNGKLDVILDTANFSAKKYTINMAISSNNRYEDVYRIPTTLTIIKRNAILNIDNTTTHTNGKTTNTCNSERYRWNSS